MKHREPPKDPVKNVDELDRLSSLPTHIIDHILSHLPIKDAVRTSVLSSRWRYKWAGLPSLVFDNQCVSLTTQDQAMIKGKLVNIIDHVLLLHAGPVHKFKLSHRDLIGVTDIDRWILHLSRSPIREFILEIWKGHRYKPHSSLFSLESLTHLELFNCLLKPPSTFGGFKNLKSLDLQHVSMAQNVFENMITSCPLLERLTLMNFDSFAHLNVNAPNLLFFDVGGVFRDVTFTNTHNLALVSIGLYVSDKIDKEPPLFSSNLLKFFVHLPHIRRLEIQSYFLKYLASGEVPGRLPNSCLDLRYLSIRINFNDMEENAAALCILRSAPNLQELEMLARPEEGSPRETFTSFWEDERQHCVLKQLQLVKVSNISGTKTELNFMRFILLASSQLERMTVTTANRPGGSDIMKELLRFRRASPYAEIIYIDS
ncbi:hypothetical protein MLD38_012933 [Melastoma candidum]|uniref:Uncharacterized protein n=1 Tax=Melastoma candidum TaxID=119954 RepID=A0ACB9R7X8_9MYRT|nr:hypothetical protein MLD38_012933 [Melastoma candidum]